MRNFKLSILICFIALLVGCTAKTVDTSMDMEVLSKGSPVNLIVATDIHFLAPELVEDGPRFEKMYLNGDGKQVNYINEITDVFIDEVIDKHPDGLILSGDLTFNGEKKSHEELANKLKKVKDKGIPVMVIPGNHDINNYNAFGYTRGSVYSVDRVTADDFKEIYGQFGWDNAIERDENSLSYVSAISEDLWVIMIDTNKYKNNSRAKPSQASGEISKETYKWLEKCLEEAKSKGITPITVMHHNLLKHNEVVYEGYTLDNSNQIIALLNKYNVKLNLSGHIHAQNIAKSQIENNIIYDIATSSLSVYTNQYGEVEFLPDKSISYKTTPIDVESWAKDNYITDKNLLNFEKYSYDFFRTNGYDKAMNDFKKYNLANEDINLMADTIADLNPHYFSGTVDLIYKDMIESDGYKLWEKYSNISLGSYVNSILNQPIKDENNIIIPLDN